MKFKIQLSSKWVYTNVLIVIVAFLLTMCLYLDDIEYPSSVVAGEEATFTMKVRVEAAEASNDVRLVVGYLVPKSWNATENTTVTYNSSIDEGTMTMSLVPEETLPKNAGGLTWSEGIRAKYNFGPNVLDDMEWVVYWSDQVYNVANGENLTADVFLKTLIGPENLKVKLGFFVNHTNDGLGDNTDHFKVLYTDCITVTEGEGDVVDFCELHFNSIQPLRATQDDIVTIKYQGDIGENDLDGVTDIFLCSEAITDQGNVYTVCNYEPGSKMRKESQFGRTFSITMWPADYYGIPDGENIEKMEYSFTNSDGSLVVQQVNDDLSTAPFTYTFKCQ